MNAIVRPPIGHGVLGLVVELDHPPLVKAGLGHVFRVGTNEEVHLLGGEGRGVGGGMRGVTPD